jgi:type IV pilus assembly protein PilN
MVHLFDELVKTIPASARLNGLKQTGDSMTLDGVAQSNASVAEYMRNIESSQWMGHADLRKTENTHGDSRLPYAFGLDVALSRPKSDDNGDGSSEDRAPASASSTANPPAATHVVQPAKAATAAAPVTPVAAPVPATPAANGGAK